MNGVGDAPTWLPDAGRILWEKLVRVLGNTVVELDREALINTCSAYATAEAAMRDLAENGPLIAGDRGMVKNPAAQIARDSGATFRYWCAKFGLTPADRQTLGLVLGEEVDTEGID